MSKDLIISKLSLKGSLGSWIEANIPQKSTPHIVLVYERLFLNLTVFCLFNKLMNIQSQKKPTSSVISTQKFPLPQSYLCCLSCCSTQTWSCKYKFLPLVYLLQLSLYLSDYFCLLKYTLATAKFP